MMDKYIEELYMQHYSHFCPGPMYINKEGKEITVDEWEKLLVDSSDYKIIGRNEINNKHISTIWLGLKSLGGYFETVVFNNNHEYTDEYYERYMTLEEAKEGHARIVEEYSRKIYEKV
jgi:hypothetical protein